MTVRKYGTPPLPEQCVDAEPPPTLVTKLNQRVLEPVALTGMAPGALGRDLSPSSIARQLNLAFDWGNPQPVRVAVPPHGTFLIGPYGWELVG